MNESIAKSSYDAPVKPRQRQGKYWLLGGGVLIFGLVAAGFAVPRLDPEPTAMSPRVAALRVPTAEIEPRPNYRVKRSFIGRVEALQESSIGFELDGLLQTVGVDEGDTVEAGEVLARLDRSRLNARRQELVAALNQARANLSLAEITLKRFRGVLKAGGVTAQALDEAKESRNVAEAALTLARSRIATIDVDLGKTELRAPFDALVTHRSVDQGQVLPAGQPVLTLQQRGHREVRVGVSGRFADAVTVDDEFTVTVAGQTFAGKVKAVLPVRAASTRTVDVIVALGEGSQRLRTGELARLELTEHIEQSGYWLPLAALAEGNRGLWTSYAVEPLAGAAPLGATHRLVPHTVEILYEESDRVFARGTLQAGDVIVTAGLHRVVPGQTVRLSTQAVAER
jgi:RND family efflux transporter MFP subunit